MSTRRSSPRVPHHPSNSLSRILRSATRVHVPPLTIDRSFTTSTLHSLKFPRAARSCHQHPAAIQARAFLLRQLPHTSARTMSTISLSDLEFVTRESLASDFKSSGKSLPENTAIIDVRNPSFTNLSLIYTKLTMCPQSRYETATTLVVTSKAQHGSPHRNWITKLPS